MPWWPFWEGDPLKWYECIGMCIVGGLFGYLTALKFVEWYLQRNDLTRHKRRWRIHHLKHEPWWKRLLNLLGGKR